MKTTALLAILIIGAACQFAPQTSRAQGATTVESDFIGQTWFPLGDSIEITSCERTDNQMTIKGHYNLVSHDAASLELHITTMDSIIVTNDAEQSIKISKGSGDFELTHLHVVPGLPHVSMYADGHTFASYYFGTEKEAIEESKAAWITNSMPAKGSGN